MRRARQLWLLLAIFLYAPGVIAASFPWDDYGPACQWLRLAGTLRRPAGMTAAQPLLLTVTYRLPEQKVPAMLLTNAPVSGDHFLFVLAGFQTDIQGVIFVPPIFFFAERVEFQYFVASADRKRRSPLHTSVYRAERHKKDGQVLCQTRIALEELRLEE